MVTAHLAVCSGVGRQGAGGENVLPEPFMLSTGILLRQGMGQIDFAQTGLQIFLMQEANPLKVIFEQGNKSNRQGRRPVLVTLAGTDRDLFVPEIDVLDPKPDRFHDPETAAIKQLGHKLRCPVHEGENATHLLTGEHLGNIGFLRDRTASISWSKGVLRNLL